MSIHEAEKFLDSHIVTNRELDNYVDSTQTKRVKPITDFQEAVSQSFQNSGTPVGEPLPWNKTMDIIFRPHEITIWTGFNGHKKSLILGQVTLGFIALGAIVCIASPEMSPIQTIKRMARQFSGQTDVPKEHLERFFSWSQLKLWLYDQNGTLQPEVLLKIIRYCVDKIHINHFIIDSLMKCGIAEDDFNKQKRFIDELATIAKDMGIHIHLVAHQRKPSSSTNRPGNKYGVAGSANITNLADNVIIIYEGVNKKTKQLQNWLIVEKQRNYEGRNNPHPKYQFFFDNASLQFKDELESPVYEPCNWTTLADQIKKTA